MITFYVFITIWISNSLVNQLKISKMLVFKCDEFFSKFQHELF